MLRAKTAGIAAVLQSLSGVIFVSGTRRLSILDILVPVADGLCWDAKQTYTVPYMLSDQHAGWGAKTGERLDMVRVSAR